MYKYIIKRLLLLIPVLIGVSLVVFVMLEITPGDPARQLAGSDASEEAVEQLREEMGLNDPAPTRFIRYIWNACHGDLGKSYTTKAPVVHEIMNRFPTTFTLACLSTLIAGVTGILLGIISATHQYSFLDRFATVFALLGVSMPVFWLGMMLIVFFSVKLAILPSSGLVHPFIGLCQLWLWGIEHRQSLRDRHGLPCWKLSARIISVQPGQKDRQKR